MYDDICSFISLAASFSKARISHRYAVVVANYSFQLEANLFNLQSRLEDRTYHPRPYKQFTVTKPKTRRVSAPYFEDRIVQHSLVSQIEPIFEKLFIYDSYACRKNKGTHFALKRLKKFLRASASKYPNEEIFILKCDIRKFFQSISWDILVKIISQKIEETETLWLIKQFIVGFQIKEKHLSKTSEQLSLFEPEDLPVSSICRQGLPIGNLTSQLFANIYLNRLDYFVKQNLKEKYYGRYMDDFFIISPDKEKLKEDREKIRLFLQEVLKLELHPRKTFIQKVDQGVCFVGYRVFANYVLVRGSTLINFCQKYSKKRKKYKKGLIDQDKLERCQQSFRGHLKHANAYSLSQKMFGKEKKD